jgi:hypothetical protein
VIVRRQRAVIALVVWLGSSGSAWAQLKSADPARPEAAKPEAAKPEAAKREVAEPGAAKPDEEPAWQKTPTTRRGGFTGGFTIGGALGSGAGYPNDVKKIGREAYYTETGVAAGGIGMVWAGAALTDWFNFSLGLGMRTLFTDTTERSAVTLAFRVEAFPLFPLGDRWRDLGDRLGLDRLERRPGRHPRRGERALAARHWRVLRGLSPLEARYRSIRVVRLFIRRDDPRR